MKLNKESFAKRLERKEGYFIMTERMGNDSYGNPRYNIDIFRDSYNIISGKVTTYNLDNKEINKLIKKSNEKYGNNYPLLEE